jgi:hypothetical protein
MALETTVSTQASDLPGGAALYRLATAYQVTEAVYVAAKLGLADLLASGPASSLELAERAGAHAPALRRLMRALAAHGVVAEIEPDYFALTPVGECLRIDTPASARSLVMCFGSDHFRQTWAQLEHCVRTGESAVGHLFGSPNPFDYYRQHPDVGEIVVAGLTGLATVFAEAVVAAYAFPDQGTVIDLGGGEGRLLGTLLNARPLLRGVLLDLPEVVPGATRLLEEAGVANRCQILAGDLFAGAPAGGDLYILSRVIHDWDDEAAVAIIRSARAAMNSRSRLLLVERVLPSHPDATVANQSQLLSDLNMLVMTSGRERTAEEYKALLAAAGLRFAQVIGTRAPISIIEAVPA